MNPVSVALLRSGVLSEEMKAQFQQWGVATDVPEESALKLESPEQVAAAIEAALQSEGLVINRVTDLDMLKQFLATQRYGTLHLTIGDASAEFAVTFGRTIEGDIILPWRAEALFEAMVDPETYLRVEEEEGTRRIFFRDAREIFYGDVKAFMVCARASVEVVPQDPLLVETDHGNA